MSKTLFGTDGIRGVAGEYPLVPELLEKLGRVLAMRILGDLPDNADAAPRVLIGHDGRESGETIAAAVAAGLTHGGVPVDVVGLTSTPCLAYLTFADCYQAGVMVSASHNPARDNGIKLFGRQGTKLADAVEAELETALAEVGPPPEGVAPAEIRRTKSLVTDYISWLRNEAFPELELKGRRILVDCANGAASELAPRVLKTFGADVVTIHDKPDGHNINDGCGALHPEVAAAAVQEYGCEVGLSLDGDADRSMLVDATGRVLDGDAILAGLGCAMEEAGDLPGHTVVATVMSNLALERMVKDCGAHLKRTAVGDRYVAEAMREGGFRLGGEKSGHVLFGEDHGFRGDGIYTLLRVMEVLVARGQEATAFAAGYADLPQRLVNLPATRRVPLEELPALSAACTRAEEQLGNEGRIVVRFSGTELLLRLMVEAVDDTRVDDTLAELEAAAREDGILA